MGKVTVKRYERPDGVVPFDAWVHGLRDRRARVRILNRVDRLSLGLEGDWKPVGGDVRELRIPEGPGYRVYYAWSGRTAVLLLCGGDKSSQSRDIEEAQAYWAAYCNER